LPYDRLVIATGARPRPLPGLSPDDPRISFFKTTEDALRWRQSLERGELQSVAIIGGGYIGCELAEAFRAVWGCEVELIEALEALAGRYGIGRGIHLGDTVLGTKGRVAFEAPAAITLISAHRELEKLVLSAQQARIKDSLAAVYGDLVHEGKQLDLVCADIEALLESSQRRVSGSVAFTLRPGALFIDGVDSPHSLLAATKGVYGESAGEWTPADTLGYARILSLTGSLQTRASGGEP